MSSTTTYTQADRLLRLDTPLGSDALLLVGVSGHEAMSQPFGFTLDALAENASNVEFHELLGQPVTVMLGAPGGERYFNGIVRRIGRGARHETFTDYRLEVVPQFWLLSKRTQSRIFQQMAVPDILKEVLQGLDVTFKLQGTFEPRNYCAQYRESDFHFASRLMEEEGIYYFFEHSASGHTMVIADTPASHPVIPGGPTIRYDDGRGGFRPDDRIREWEKTQELTAGKVLLWDHSFELPHKHLEADKPMPDSVSAGRVSHKLKLKANSTLEIYDYPGGYAQRFDGVAPGGGDRDSDLQKIFQDNKRTVEIRSQEEAASGLAINGTSDCRQLVSGHRFKLDDHFDGNGEYVLLSVEHRAQADTYRSDRAAFSYENRFTCIPFALPFRARRLTPKPRVEGCQTAVVVGPAGEEIFTDKYGRVKVQFHWDRAGKNDANSSCWLRVATPWAGKAWGAVHIPRIGQEVVVDFLEGDPDRPIIVGSVYNADQTPPYTLPEKKTQSGLKSRSTPKAGAENFNEFRFEDKKGEEQVYLHAERNLDTVVENDESRKVGFQKQGKGDQTIEVFNNQQIRVGAGTGEADDGSQTVQIYKDQTLTLKTGDQTTTIEQGDQTLKVTQGKQTETIQGDQTVTIEGGNQALSVKKGNQSIELGMGNQKLDIKMGNQTVELGMGNRSVKLKLGKSTEEAMQGIELKVGQSSITIDQTGVTIKGMMVKIEGQIKTEVKGLMTEVSGSAMLTAKGGITMIN